MLLENPTSTTNNFFDQSNNIFLEMVFGPETTPPKVGTRASFNEAFERNASSTGIDSPSSPAPTFTFGVGSKKSTTTPKSRPLRGQQQQGFGRTAEMTSPLKENPPQTFVFQAGKYLVLVSFLRLEQRNFF